MDNNSNIVDKAWEILQKFAESLTLKSFLEKIKPTVEQYKDLSLAQIKIKVLEYIKNEQPFGEALAEGASYALGENIMLSEAEQEAENVLREQLSEEILADYKDVIEHHLNAE